MTNYFFSLPQNLISLIFEYDPTYHEIWRNIFDPSNYLGDCCEHGTWTTCAHPRCKRLLKKGKSESKHRFWSNIYICDEFYCYCECY